MGIWGNGIYENDTAAEVKDLCNEVFPFVSIEEGNNIVFKEFEETVRSEEIDNDVASFWYALADWQWKHGVLTDKIRSKAIDLLAMYAGIHEWEESSTTSNVKRRIKIIDKLKTQLESPMPAAKLPKRKLLKPKHRAGDIIIFNIGGMENTTSDGCWLCDCGHTPFEYANPYINKSPEHFSSPISAYNKYLAILCIGSENQLHSERLANIYDEYSVYAFYDYCDVRKPSVELLKQCGFLPCITHSYSTQKRVVNDIGWTYKFTTSSSFRFSSSYGITSVERLRCIGEPERFNILLRKKDYSDKSVWCLDMHNAFGEFFEEKARLLCLGIKIDTLLDANDHNPALLNDVSI